MSDQPSLRLDAPREQVLAHAVGLIAEAWRGFDHARPEQPEVDATVRSLLLASLPADATPATSVLEDAARILDESIAQPRPRYFAFVGSSGLEIGVIGDALASCFDPNLAVYAGAASDIEEQAVRWVGELVGYPAAAGAFTSGGTISNLTGLAAARERALPGVRRDGLGGRRAAVYCSAEAHYSIERAVEVFGIGTQGVRVVAIDDHRRMRPEALAAAIDADRADGVTPVAVVATAGTTLTGAIDPIAAIADVCSDRGVWLHIDGAYGLAAAAVPSRRASFAGLERADSATLDAHKWLYLPKACGVVMVRDATVLETTFGHEEGICPTSSSAATPSMQRSSTRGRFARSSCGSPSARTAPTRFARRSRATSTRPQLLVEEVSRHPDLELLTSSPALSIVPFRHVPGGVSDLNAHNAQLTTALQRDGRVYVAPAAIDGHVYLRPCFVNYRTSNDDVRALVEVAREVGQALSAR